MKALATLLLTCLATAVSAAAGDCIVVDGDRIYAADLARQRPVFQALDPGLMVGYSPLPGLTRTFTSRQLTQFLGRHGVAEPVGEHLCVERRTIHLAEADVVDALEDVVGADAHLDVVDFTRGPVPPGELRFDMRNLRAPTNATPDAAVLWRGEIVYGSRKSAAIWVRVRVWETRQQVVADRDLRAGDEISREDVRLETADVFLTADHAVEQLDEVFGATLRRSIRAGEPLRMAELRLPNDIDRGQMVTVEVVSGAARLRFDGRAETSGRSGDRVFIENPANGERFSAIVAGPLRAVVDAGPSSFRGGFR